MTDERSRELERRAVAGDTEAAVKALRERVRSGALSQGQVELAARLGNVSAAALSPDATRFRWSSFKDRQHALLSAQELLGDKLPARVSAAWAARALPVWEQLYPEEPTIRAALAAIESWISEPTEESLRLLPERRLAAARTAILSRRGGNFGQHLDAAEAVGFAASTALESDPEEATRSAAHTASYAAKTAPVPELESEWQQAFLAALVLKEPLRATPREGPTTPDLRQRAEAGDLTEQHLLLGAQLGFLDALPLAPESRIAGWESAEARMQRLEEATALLDSQLPTRVAADWAECVLTLWGLHDSADTRPERAIAAARAWADRPCDELARAADEAVDAAVAASEEAEDFAADVASAAASAAESCARGSAAASATAGFVLDAVVNRETFGRWQRLRLARYVLGLAQVDLDPPAPTVAVAEDDDRYDPIRE